MNGFPVGHSVQPCTKGIWLWSEPIFLDDDTILIVLDCEGLYSTGKYILFILFLFHLLIIVRDQKFDAKIFTLSMLISSIFIYNQLGHIDEKSIENMSLIINLCKVITANEKNKKF
jgi:hypothetical protein